LALWLIWPSGRASAEKKSTSSPNHQTAQPAACQRVAVRTDSGSSGTDAGVAFHWSQVESDDYRQYLANLRAIGCPEHIARDIIITDLHQQYVGKLRAVWPGPSKREFWQKPDDDGPAPFQMRRREALDEEERNTLHKLLGVRDSLQELMGVLSLQTDRYEVELAFLPPDKRALAEQAFSEAALRESDADEPNYEFSFGQRDTRLLGKRLAVLTNILSPEELNEYRLRLTPEAEQVRAVLQHVECSPEEFGSLAKIKSQLERDLGWPEQYHERRRRECAEARKLLGEQRGEQYARNQDWTWICASEAAVRYGLAPEAPEQVWALKKTVEASASRLRADPSLSSEERRAKLTALQSEAKAGLTRVLGERAARLARRYDPWLQRANFVEPDLMGRYH
jgi:hypothetical protein